jgi:hypothetical protein
VASGAQSPTILTPSIGGLPTLTPTPNLPTPNIQTSLLTESYSYVSLLTDQQVNGSYSVSEATVGGRTFVPLSQLDEGQFLGDTTALSDAEYACAATVYTMIARATGNPNATVLQFWDAIVNETPIPLPAGVSIGATQPPVNWQTVTTLLQSGNPVILKGTVNKLGGGTENHYMLATSITSDGNIVANDPWTGQQVVINSQGKVVQPSNYALPSFTVTNYQTVSIQ